MELERLVEDQSADYIGKKAPMEIKENGVWQKLTGAEKVPVAAGYDDGNFVLQGREVSRTRSNKFVEFNVPCNSQSPAIDSSNGLSY